LKYVCDIVVKSSRSLSHLLMSSCLQLHLTSGSADCRNVTPPSCDGGENTVKHD